MQCAGKKLWRDVTPEVTLDSGAFHSPHLTQEACWLKWPIIHWHRMWRSDLLGLRDWNTRNCSDDMIVYYRTPAVLQSDDHSYSVTVVNCYYVALWNKSLWLRYTCSNRWNKIAYMASVAKAIDYARLHSSVGTSWAVGRLSNWVHVPYW